jgi:hypothetical protein
VLPSLTYLLLPYYNFPLVLFINFSLLNGVYENVYHIVARFLDLPKLIASLRASRDRVVQYSVAHQRERKGRRLGGSWLPLFVCLIPGQNHECYRRTDNARGDTDEEREENDVFEEPGDGEHDNDEDRDRYQDPYGNGEDIFGHFSFSLVL